MEPTNLIANTHTHLKTTGQTLFDTPVRHSCKTLFYAVLMCDTLVTLVRHSCRTLLWGTLLRHSCGTLLWGTLVGQSSGLRGLLCGTVLWDTLAGHSTLLSYGTLL